MRFLLVLACFVAPLARGSSQLDEDYSLRNASVLMLNAAKDPIYSEQVETELVRRLTETARFELHQPSLDWLKKNPTWATGEIPIPADDAADADSRPALVMPEDVRKLIRDAGTIGAQAVFVGAIVRRGDEVSVALALVNAKTGETLHSVKRVVEDPMKLPGFAKATADGLARLLDAIPFDASILSRQGQKLVLDRGSRGLRSGQRLVVFTLEPGSGLRPTFVPVGEIQVTRADATLGFAYILNEESPGAIRPGNKLRFTARAQALARTSPSIESRYERGHYGTLDVHIGGAMTEYRTTGTPGTQAREAFFPGGNLEGELWLTRKWALQAHLGFSTGTLGVNASATQIGILGMYRLHFHSFFPEADSQRAEIQLRAGYGRRQYQANATSDPLTFATSTYTGLLVGGGFRLPVVGRFGMGFDLNALLFPSVEESPLTSGTSTRVSGWDFSVKTYWNASEDLNVDLRFVLQNYSADFDNSGNRPLLSTAQSSRALLIGITKYL